MEHPIRAIRRAGVPLAVIESADPAMTIASAMRALNGKGAAVPTMQWDIMRGLASTRTTSNITEMSSDIRPVPRGAVSGFPR